MLLHVDVLIIGGGNAGATLASVFGARGISVAVVDQLDPAIQFDAEFDGRTIAITHGSANLYRSIGAWDDMCSLAEPITNIITQDNHAPIKLEYRSADIGDQPMGYIFEMHKFRQYLYKFATQYNTVKWFAPDRVQSINRTQTGVYATLQSGQEIKAYLCVAADGRGSKTREYTEIKVSKRSYNQTAIVCCIDHEKPHHGMAMEIFMPNGPFASLPMQGNRSSIVWSENPKYVNDLMVLENDKFCKQMLLRLGDQFGSIQLVGKKWSYPLGVHIMHTYIDQRLAFIADAAHGMHPIAGQGFNMGVQDIAALAEVVLDAKDLGLDIGGYTVLEKYQRWRRFDNAIMVGLTDILTRGFSNQMPVLRFLRRTGLGVVENVSLLKIFFMKRAMGINSKNPKLLQYSPLN